MELPENIEDGMVFKISDNCWAEYISIDSSEFNRRAWRLSDRFGRGVLIEDLGLSVLHELLERSRLKES